MRFRILGPLEVRHEGRLVAIGRPQQRALLAVLLLHPNHVVSTDRLEAHLWGERPPPDARALLQGCVARLRRALRTAGGEQPLETRPPGYLLRVRPGELDVERFETLAATAAGLLETGSIDDLERAAAMLAEALTLWRGPLLEDIPLDACRADATRLEERRLGVLEERIDADLRLGRLTGLVPELQALVAAHPLRERLWAQLMLALCGTDRQADALDTYRQVRRTLVEQLGVEPGPALRGLQRTILSGADAFGAYRRRGPPAAAPPPEPDARPPGTAPAQLPAVVGGFTGRDGDVKHLDEMLAGATEQDVPAMPIGIICGTAGVGKTAFAVHWAHRVRGRFADGQLYVNLRGHAQSAPVRPIDALVGFLEAFGVPPERVPVDVDRAASLFRTLLADRRVLVVLDNAASVEQVRPLLPASAGCLVLVTSRERLGGLVARDGAELVALDVLEPGEAHALLARLVGHERVHTEPEATAELAELCAMLPLALRIAAAQLICQPLLRIADQVADLAGGDPLTTLAVDDDEQSAVRAAFDLSYGSLSTEARRLFRLLGLVPGADVTVGAAAALAGTTADRAGRLLARLTRAHLLDELGAGRFAFHDLLRRYAAERARHEDTADERAAVTGRLYRWYRTGVEAAAGLVYPNMLRLADDPTAEPGRFADHTAALRWLEAERHNLVATIRHTARYGPKPAAYHIADALRGYLFLRRYTPEWVAVAEAALAAAGDTGDVRAQAAALHSLGTAWRSLGEHRGALRHYARALRLARQCGWHECEATMLGNIGITCQKLGRLRAAARQLTLALHVDRRTGRRAGEANNLFNLGNVYHQMGRLEDAARHHTEALELNTLSGSRHGQALALTGLGEACHELGRLAEATAHLTDALRHYLEIGDRDGQAVILHGLAAVHCSAGRPGKAREQALESLALARDTGDRRTEASARNALAASAVASGRYAEAIEEYRQAHLLAKETSTLRLEIEALVGMAAAYRGLRDLDRAGDRGRTALALAAQFGYRVLEGQAHTELAAVRLAAGDREAGLVHAERALSCHRETGHQPGTERTSILTRELHIV